MRLVNVWITFGLIEAVSSFVSTQRCFHTIATPRRSNSNNNEDNGWTSDFDDFVSDDSEDSPLFAPLPSSQDAPLEIAEEATSSTSLFKTARSQRDLTATQSRLFSLGQDIILSDFVGNMGFDEVTDWDYYYANEEDPDDRTKRIQPNPFDEAQPRRTRKKSGSVIRIFRGEFTGLIGGILSSRGLDRRVLVKEFTGDMAQQLARYERLSVGRMQSDLLSDNDDVADGEWIRISASRSVTARQDNANVAELSAAFKTSPFLGIYGEIDLAELEDGMDPNEFYRALSVPPPKSGAIWVVYEYVGLNSVASYSVPAEIRRSRIPPKKGFFGNVVEAPPLPRWRERANYVVKGIMRKSMEALATLHESGIAHRSIGRSSLVITSINQDKQEASDLYNTRTQPLVVKLADFGFSGMLEEAAYDEEFCSRARSFGFNFKKGDTSLAVTNFAMAEDLHALGFVFLGLILSTLAELPAVDYPMPATDEDTLQRLLAEIFDKDVKQFREYLEAEEVWGNLVMLLDEDNEAGWNVLESLFLAREKAAENKNSLDVVTARILLASPFFQS